MNNGVLLFGLILLMSMSNLKSQERIMTLNIRFDNPSDGEDRWELRRQDLCNLLIDHKLDFIGIQEALPNQVDFIDRQLKDYDFIGFGRDGKGTASESVPIFFRKGAFELIESEVFWLSETPEAPSKGWDAALNRITTYGRFLNKMSKDTIHVFNTHFDHKGKIARQRSSELLLEKLAEMKLKNKKVIVMGDLNSEPDQLPIRTLEKELKDSFNHTQRAPKGPVGTFNAFDTRQIPRRRIDYIFCRNLEIINYEAMDVKRANGRWISDHLPILVELQN
jgi:endonuclease/exonuclease/phosphatase family metal-dependent hydrolase